MVPLVRLAVGLVLIAFFAAPAFAGEERRRPPENALFGQVVKVEGDKLIIKTRGEGGAEGKEVTVATDANTKVTIDGKEAKLSDLKPGNRVVITPKEGVAKEIRCRTQPPPRREK